MIPVVYRFPEWIPLLGGQAITTFGLLLFVAFLAGGSLFRRRLGHGGSETWELVVYAAAGGLVGAKLLHLLIHASMGLPTAGFGRGGLNWFGGLIGGAAAVAWRARALRLDLARVAAAAAPALAIGYAIGRVGSFLVGADYGLPTWLPVGVPFPAGAPPTTPANLLAFFGAEAHPGSITGEFARVHPTQLYEAILALGILGVLEQLRRRSAGAVGGWRHLALFLILSGLARMLVEPLRAKQDVLAGPVTADLLLALATVVAGIWLYRRPPDGNETRATEPA